MGTFKDLKGVEIFRIGTWKGDSYVESDLQDMINAYDKVGFKPPIKSGHSEDVPGLPALGWVENLRCENGHLLADFNQLYPEVYEAIKDKRYNTVSSEIYFNYKQQDGTILPKVLKAVAILGQDVPAVKNLKPLHESLVMSDDTLAEKIGIYESGMEFQFASSGVQFVIGKLKGDTSTTVQTVLFSKSEWTIERAKGWLSSHNMHADKVDEGDKHIRFRQYEPSDFIEGSFRTIEPGVAHNSSSDLYKLYNEVIKQEEVKKMDIEARMKELEDKFTKVVASKDSEITDLQGKLTTLSAELEKAKTESAKFSDTDAGKKVHQLQKQLEDTTVQLEQTMQKFAEAEKKKFTLEEVQRKERIERKVKDLKFPALRPYIEVFYEEATKGESESKVVKFSADGSAPKELTVERVVDGFVSTLNRLAENKMFSELSTMPEFKRDDVPTSDDPAVEVDKRVREYCAKHNLDVIKSYGDAQTKVFLEDPKLKELYAQS